MNEFFIDESGIEGFGCFTRRFIKSGELFTFTVLPVNRNINNHHKFPFDSTRSCIILSEFSYCNHSKTPNMEPVNIDITLREVSFRAITDIEPYTEITFDYGNENTYH